MPLCTDAMPGGFAGNIELTDVVRRPQDMVINDESTGAVRDSRCATIASAWILYLCANQIDFHVFLTPKKLAIREPAPEIVRQEVGVRFSPYDSKYRQTFAMSRVSRSARGC